MANFKKINPRTNEIIQSAPLNKNLSQSHKQPKTDNTNQKIETRAKKATQDTKSTAIKLREGLLESAQHVIEELGKRARGDFYDEHINLADQLRIMEYVLPIIHQAQDNIHLESLASQTPEERTNTILQAVATGQISAKHAMEVVNVMKMLQELTGGSSDETGKLIINLAPGFGVPTEKTVN